MKSTNKFLKVAALLLCLVLTVLPLTACADGSSDGADVSDQISEDIPSDESSEEVVSTIVPEDPDFSEFTPNLPDSIVLEVGGKETAITASSSGKEILEALRLQPDDVTEYSGGATLTYYSSLMFDEKGTDPSMQKMFMYCLTIGWNDELETKFLGFSNLGTAEDAMKILGAPDHYSKDWSGYNYYWDSVTVGNDTFELHINASKPSSLRDIRIYFEVPNENGPTEEADGAEDPEENEVAEETEPEETENAEEVE